MTTRISAVVCTYNRCESLCRTLRSLAAQQLPDDVTMEIIVVDNNSTDRTRQVTEEAARTSPWPIRYVFEKRQGLSCARNAGVRAAATDILAFVDDDVKVEPQWACALWECFRQTHCDAVAGKVNMLWECPRPRWLAEELHGPLISQDLGSQRQRWPSRRRFMLGANMAFRRRVFERLGGFNEALGRKGASLIGGEDRDISERLLTAGGTLYYEPKAVVWHTVDQQRVSQPYLRRWYHDTGRTIGHQMTWQWSYRLTVAPLWVWKQLLTSAVRYAKGRLRLATGEDERFAAEMWLRFYAAALQERWHHWLPPSLAARACPFLHGSSEPVNALAKRALYQSFLRLVYLASAVSQRIRRAHPTRLKRLGLVTFEFFRADLNGYGGYGKVVQNVSDYCNLRSRRFRTDVLLAMAQRNGTYVERCHNADVVFKYKPRCGLFRNLWQYPRYIMALNRRGFEALITIEYYIRYEPHVLKFPATPVLVWIQDPRTADDWDNIGTVTLADVESARAQQVRWVEESRQSFQRLLQASACLKRPVLFAHQAECLVPKARQLYDAPSLPSRFLPNPIDVPSTINPKASTPTVCFLGRLDPIKRPWIFFELAKRMRHVEFLVLGRTHCADVMDGMIQRYRDVPNLRFLGLVDGQEKQQVLQRSWALVNTSIHEALPVSFLEAFAASTPVVSCREADGLVERFGVYTGEALGDGMDARSLETFQAALEQLLAHPDERAEKGAAARRYVENVHTYERFEATLDGIVEELGRRR